MEVNPIPHGIFGGYAPAGFTEVRFAYVNLCANIINVFIKLFTIPSDRVLAFGLQAKKVCNAYGISYNKVLYTPHPGSMVANFYDHPELAREFRSDLAKIEYASWSPEQKHQFHHGGVAQWRKYPAGSSERQEWTSNFSSCNIQPSLL